ncbi:MAG: endonuclease/exonuclease/phosphatase family protein [Longimicrobiales bacterium]
MQLGDPHPDLENWRANVGEPISLDLAPPLAAPPFAIDVLCWNVAIGKGRLTERLRALTDVSARVTGTRPLVVLVQEAYRTDDSVPEASSAHHGGKAPRNLRENIADVARALNFSLRYAPSMRNGNHRSDRGNAILTSAAIAGTHWLTLPYVRQRREAMAVKLAGTTHDIWFGNAHLDTHGRHRPHPVQGIRATQRGFGAGRAAQAAALADSLLTTTGPDADVVLGGDLNSYLGLRDPVMRELVSHGFRHSTRVGRWRHTFHGPIRLMLDHVMFRPSRGIESVQVRRLDEGTDRSRRVFGSDHHPLLATVTLR